MASLGIGFWKSLEEIASQWKVERQFDPGVSADERKIKLSLWQQGIERSRKWAERRFGD